MNEDTVIWSVVKKTGGRPDEWTYWEMDGKTVFHAADARKALAQARKADNCEDPHEKVLVPVPERLKQHFEKHAHQYGYHPYRLWSMIHSTGHYEAMDHVGNPDHFYWDTETWVTITDPTDPQYPGFWSLVTGRMGRHPHKVMKGNHYG